MVQQVEETHPETLQQFNRRGIAVVAGLAVGFSIDVLTGSSLIGELASVMGGVAIGRAVHYGLRPRGQDDSSVVE